ncbi:unnamed protein product [Effrenium voratum]|uniref:Crinkler effector protein N-terminal domain-containing protein n=1 Tax=Effrenium voratum TaxID=2562239 RepID=A0AA36IFA1_9DINO|nr:unnamed protein product [Effrenium voratum]
MAMAVMRARIQSQGACLSLGMRWRCSLQWPSTESLSAAHEFSRGVPGRKDRNGAPASSQRWLHAGVALRARAAREDNNAEDRLHLEEAIAEAKRVLQDNDTVEKIKAVLRKAQKINPGKWTLSGKKDELKQKLREFVEEAKATLKGLKEDSRRAQVTSWHPGRGGVASRASPQQDSGAEDRRDLEEVVAEADRVLEDNGTVKETKAVLRKAQKIYPEEMPVKRRIPKAEDPAVFTTDVFIPLDETIRKLDVLLQDERVVFLRAGVASGKSTLAQHLCTTQPSKYFGVHAPLAKDATIFEMWERKMRAAVWGQNSNVKDKDLQDMIRLIYDNDQVLVFDECHLLFACPEFHEQFLKKPSYLKRRPMVLLLSAASEGTDQQGRTYLTPAAVTAKYMWTPPIPHANELVDQLAEADVYLSQDAVAFFMDFCAGHRSLFIRSMEWVQQKQSGDSTRWDLTRAQGEVSQAWDTDNWTEAPDDSLMGKLQTVRAIRVNGAFSDPQSIPQQFVDILCEGPTADMDANLRRKLTLVGFTLPVVPATDRIPEEFTPLDWAKLGTKYGVANYMMASYYRQALAKKRQLTVDVDRSPTSCTDLLLRALPYLLFADVVAIQGDKFGIRSDVSQEELPFEVHYTHAAVRELKRLVGSTNSLESTKKGKVDIYTTLEDGSTFAIEAVMSSRGATSIAKHRDRFESASMTNYAHAQHKCLLIIGKCGDMREIVGKVRDGIEVVGLAPNPSHTGYYVYVKRQGEKVVDFHIPCDGVARGFSWKDEEPFFEISSAQKFKYIEPGSAAPQRPPAVWVCQLGSPDGKNFEVIGNPFQVKGVLANVDDLKEAIKQKKPNTVSCDADELDIYSRQDGGWVKEETMSASLRETDEADCYGFTIPAGAAGAA